MINVFGHLSFPLFEIYLLSIYYVPAIVLGIKDTAVTEKRSLYPHGAHNLVNIDRKDAGDTGN